MKDRTIQIALSIALILSLFSIAYELSQIVGHFERMSLVTAAQ